MLALSDVDLASIGRAFDRAWDNYLRAGLLTPHNLLESRRHLAARILRSHRYGERDEWRLARDAVNYVRELQRAGRASACPAITVRGAPPRRKKPGRPAAAEIPPPVPAIAVTTAPEVADRL